MSDKPPESKPSEATASLTGDVTFMAGQAPVKKKAVAGGLAASDVRKKRQQALGAVLAPLMEPTLARQGVLLAQVVPHWRAICPLLASHSCPESLRGDTLTVAVASDGVKQELHYITPQVIEGINRLLGYEAVAKVRAVTRHDVGLKAAKAVQDYRGPTASKAQSGAVRDKADALCKSVRDDDLRAALSRLGAEIMKDSNKKS